LVNGHLRNKDSEKGHRRIKEKNEGKKDEKKLKAKDRKR